MFIYILFFILIAILLFFIFRLKTQNANLRDNDIKTNALHTSEILMYKSDINQLNKELNLLSEEKDRLQEKVTLAKNISKIEESKINKFYIDLFAHANNCDRNSLDFFFKTISSNSFYYSQDNEIFKNSGFLDKLLWSIEKNSCLSDSNYTLKLSSPPCKFIEVDAITIKNHLNLLNLNPVYREYVEHNLRVMFEAFTREVQVQLEKGLSNDY